MRQRVTPRLTDLHSTLIAYNFIEVTPTTPDLNIVF